MGLSVHKWSEENNYKLEKNTNRVQTSSRPPSWILSEVIFRTEITSARLPNLVKISYFTMAKLWQVEDFQNTSVPQYHRGTIFPRYQYRRLYGTY